MPAIVALFLGTLGERYTRFRRLAYFHSLHVNERVAGEPTPEPTTIGCRPTRRSLFHWYMQYKYEWAACRPWLPVAPDPPEPPA
jgi:hypothetical protein